MLIFPYLVYHPFVIFSFWIIFFPVPKCTSHSYLYVLLVDTSSFNLISLPFLRMTSMPDNNMWLIAPLSTPNLIWGRHSANHEHVCPWCGLLLPMGEKPGFCCGPQGKYANSIPPLPPLPFEFHSFLMDACISALSCALSLLFSSASMETMEKFPSNFSTHGFIVIQGKVYHHVWPSHPDSVIQWILYDGFACQHAPHSNWADVIPPE